jgi:hypothetical protein
MSTQRVLTSEAAAFCTARGRRVSVRTLQKLRLKGPDDPGQHGPRFFRDAVTGWCWYLESDLLDWVAELDARLVESARGDQPAGLARKRAA